MYISSFSIYLKKNQLRNDMAYLTKSPKHVILILQTAEKDTNTHLKVLVSIIVWENRTSEAGLTEAVSGLFTQCNNWRAEKTFTSSTTRS